MEKTRSFRMVIITVLSLLFISTAVIFVRANSTNGDPLFPSLEENVSADDAIVGVTTIGYMASDGTRLSAIAVEYGYDLAGADVDVNTYQTDVWTTTSITNTGGGSMGDIVNVYINDEADVSDTGGKIAGNYMIIEVYTDFIFTSEPAFLLSMSGGIVQTADITVDQYAIASSETEFGNYTGLNNSRAANHGEYTIKGIEGYQLFTNEPGLYGADGSAYTAYDCFNEKDGTTYDYDLGYALWVPEDYTPSGSYALVTIDHTISEGTHPYESLVSNYGPAYFITDEAQQIVKNTHGLDGLIVVVPQIIERVDDNSCVPAMWMALVELWDKLAEDYNVDENHIYGAGQSMGGMLLMQTNTYRDNYFAGMLCYGNQWGQNYYRDSVFARGMSNSTYNETASNTPRHYPSTADTYYIWDYYWGDDGEQVYADHDPYNFYYLISDDNLMVHNGSTNALSNNVWAEMSYLYQDLVGYTIPRLTGLDATDMDGQNAVVNAFLVADNNSFGSNEMGLYWCTWEGGSNDQVAIWSRTITAAYEWLLSQTRETQMEREKLDINRPFELADTQIQDSSRLVNGFYDKNTGEEIYFLTAKSGSGTQFYNTSWLQAGSNVSADANPGWLPAGMSHTVTAASIKGVTPIYDDDAALTAVAVEYNVDMENIVIHLVGDNVIDSKGNARADDFVTIAPYDFYDADGGQIIADITNVYVNETAGLISGAARASGSGNYVIVELDTDSTAKFVGVIQRTTIRTNEAIASALSKTHWSTTQTADNSIVGVTTIGFMDTDAAKLSAIVVEYAFDLAGADINESTYEVNVWETTWNDSTCINYGNGAIGDILNVYVNDKPDVSEENGTGSGKYVIIEVYTDYQWGSEQSFLRSMGAGVTQATDITIGAYTITSTGNEMTNYTGASGSRSAIYGTYTIKGTEGFAYYTNINDTDYPVDGAAFVAENCFNEQDGQYYTVELSYALYLPEDYDPNGTYALVTLQNPAASEGTHPMQSVLQTRSPAVFASEWAQNIVKGTHGLDGLIVAVPVVTQRVNDNACTPAEYSAIVKLWDYLQEKYSVSEDHIYGAGQSVGGMILMETNRNRDNYFAGIMMYENQWAQNYYKDEVFARGMSASNWVDTAETTPRHYPSTDSYITWDYHWGNNGEQVYEDHDANNYYYMISDDNILIMNSLNNYLSNNTWTEMNYLYTDLVGYTIPQLVVDVTTALSDQEDAIRAYLAAGSEYEGTQMGINWVSFDGGINGYSARRVDAGYEWLLSQTRESSMSRDKLDLNKPFELADEQDTDRVMTNFVDPDDGSPIYYLTGKEGSGTQFYNTVWLRTGSNVSADKLPGWLPEGMSYPVTAASMESVTPIYANGVLTAIAVEYNTDMKDVLIHLLGDNVINSKGELREDDFVTVAPYDFYDENGNQISAVITNYYVSDAPTFASGVGRGTGSGNYVILELETDTDAEITGIIQRTTVRTNEAIASASSKQYDVSSPPKVVTPYIAGFPGGTFGPDLNITRAEAAQMLYNISNGVISEPMLSATGVLSTTAVSFSDVTSGAWYYDAVSALAQKGVISGYPDGTFGPGKTITRAEFTAMVVLYTGLTDSGTSTFWDVASSHWAAGFIAAAQNNGWVYGYPDGSFGPEDSLTRAQAVTILNHSMGRDSSSALFANLEMPFSDVPKTHWAYNQIMAAAVEHTL